MPDRERNQEVREMKRWKGTDTEKEEKRAGEAGRKAAEAVWVGRG